MDYKLGISTSNRYQLKAQSNLPIREPRWSQMAKLAAEYHNSIEETQYNGPLEVLIQSTYEITQSQATLSIQHNLNNIQ